MQRPQTKKRDRAMSAKKGRIEFQAQRDLEQMLGRKVHLFLFVKVRENWLEDPARYRALGLEFDV